MKVQIDLAWKLGTHQCMPLDDAVFALLAGIQETGSLQKACRQARISYRHAWGLLTEAAVALGRPLANLSRGRGSQLAPLGSALLSARERVEARLAPDLTRFAYEISRELTAPATGIPRRWRMFASHDLVLLNARDALSRACGVEFDLAVHGSLDCLEALARRRCNVAGFHLAADQSPQEWLSTMYDRTPGQPLRVIEFAKREQGLMVRAGWEQEIRSLSDLVRTGARFVNRQRGSGTRTLLDRLLKEAKVRPFDIRGYQDEEFTHLAVAATIAGGGAEAGFGIHAAAAQFNLPFLPIERETYFLACREQRPDAGHIAQLIAFLKSSEFREKFANLPGYDVRHAGSDFSLSARGSRKKRRSA